MSPEEKLEMGRTLEEIEAEYSKGRGDGAPHMNPLGVMIDNFPRLLTIAQEQREELKIKNKCIDELIAASVKLSGEVSAQTW